MQIYFVLQRTTWIAYNNLKEPSFARLIIPHKSLSILSSCCCFILADDDAFPFDIIYIINFFLFVTVSRSGSNGGGTNNLPPLLFHNVHGENIRISRDGTISRRVESFCKGISFSSRPVKVNEKVSVHDDDDDIINF